ncbi:MAG: hypothetical protein AAGF04_02850 [Chlamydiota bacterium]
MMTSSISHAPGTSGSTDKTTDTHPSPDAQSALKHSLLSGLSGSIEEMNQKQSEGEEAIRKSIEGN